MVAINHLYGPDGRVYLAYSALLKDDGGALERADNKIFMVVLLGISLVEQRTKLRKLLVHRNYKSYFLHGLRLS